MGLTVKGLIIIWLSSIGRPQVVLGLLSVEIKLIWLAVVIKKDLSQFTKMQEFLNIIL